MAIQTINIGNQVNDGLGDDLRTAFQKVNANFAQLDSSLTVTASNVEGTGFGVFKEKVGADLRFKKLVPSGYIVIDDSDSDKLVISTNQPLGFTSIKTNTDTLEARDESDITIEGGSNIFVQGNDGTGIISIDTVLDLNTILLNFDFGFIQGNFANPLQLSLQASNIDFGTIELPGTLDLDLGVLP